MGLVGEQVASDSMRTSGHVLSVVEKEEAGLKSKMKPCARCGNDFEPVWMEKPFNMFTKACDTCKLRNFLDNLDLHTPPGLLDPHTKLPTLTEKEFKKEFLKNYGINRS